LQKGKIDALCETVKIKLQFFEFDIDFRVYWCVCKNENTKKGAKIKMPILIFQNAYNFYRQQHPQLKHRPTRIPLTPFIQSTTFPSQKNT